MAVQFHVRDTLYPGYISTARKVWRLIERKGTWYHLSTGRVELFAVATVAECIGKKSATWVEWEGLEKVPPPMYRIGGGKERRRWYSGEQIMNIHNLYFHKYEGKLGAFAGDRARYDAFFKDLRSIFYEVRQLDIPEIRIYRGA